ncbi:hypothetical protein WJX84_011227 [Apatococcus fuscideae]|uniref:C5orf34-like C-terminal domain-containing protein n=1 Tax=Apatococcus fuscideae TaxID=2026836 RepID=A0AAW1STX4_9CHLO
MHHTEDLASELSHWPDPGSPHLRHQSGMRGMDAWANSAERHGHNEHATLDSSALSSHPRSIEGDSFTQLPVSGSLEGDDAAGLAFAELPWWRSPSAVVTPHGPPVQVEQTPEAVYHCLPQHGQVHAWVKEDGSCLVLQQHGRFCLHYPPGAAEPRTYAIEAVPEQVWKLNGRDRLMLGPIARRAAMHWQVAKSQLEAATLADGMSACEWRIASSPSASQHEGALLDGHNDALLSNEVIAAAEVPGLACFCAYADGRVKVTFADRTLLRLDASRTTASLILPSGAPVQVAVRSRHGLDQYVQPAMRFAASAYRSPEDRASLAWQDACIAAQLRSTHAAAALCQSALQAGSCSRAHADASQGVDGLGGRTSFVDAWLAQNRAVLAQLP